MFRCRSDLLVLIIILSFLFLHVPASQAIAVSGIIDTDTTWTTTESPYTVTGNIQVSDGVTLTIQPGVTVMFQESISTESGFYIRVDGTLTAKGTETTPIIFTVEDRAFRWGGIVFMDSSQDWDEGTSIGSIIDHCIIEYAGNSTIYGTAAILTFSAQPYIANNTIRYTPSIGISATDILAAQSPSGQLQIVANHIHNHAEGIRLAIEGALIENNYFINNSQAIVIQTSSNDIIIRNNTIVNTEAEIQGDGINLSMDTNEDDNGIAAYFWEQTGGTLVDLEDPISPYGTFMAPDVGASIDTLVFDLTVTDDDGLQGTESVEITVVGTNEPPVARAGVDIIAEIGVEVELNATGSFDPDKGISAYLWEQLEGTVVPLSDTTASRPTFTAPAVAPEGETLTFQVTVTDTEGLQASDTVDVLIFDTNIPPIANAGTDFYVFKEVDIRLDGSNSVDPDGSIASYAWVQTQGTPVTIEAADTARPRFLTPNVGETEEDLEFQLTVTDTEGLQGVDTVTFTVFGETIPPFAVPGNPQTVLQGDTVLLWAFNSFDLDRRSVISIENNLMSSASETAGLINISLAVADAAYDLNITSNQFETVSDGGFAIYLYSWPIGITDPDIGLSGNWWGSDDAEAIEQLIFDGKDDFNLPEIEAIPAASPPGSVGSTLTYPPIVNAGPDSNASADVEVTLDGSGTYDPDSIATYEWTQQSGPVVRLKNPASDSPSFVAPFGGENGETLIFQLRVSIDGAYDDTDEAVVNIEPDQELPTVDLDNWRGCFISAIFN